MDMLTRNEAERLLLTSQNGDGGVFWPAEQRYDKAEIEALARSYLAALDSLESGDRQLEMVFDQAKAAFAAHAALAAAAKRIIPYLKLAWPPELAGSMLGSRKELLMELEAALAREIMGESK